ncbi:MAG: efflux RND transporter periplasmic adaptor subunit, partial [Acidobacteria bacterium]
LKQYGLITSQALDDARSALEASEAMTASARAQVRAANVRLSKSFITAPITGVIAFRGVNTGDRVENIGSGDPMFRIVDNRVLDLTVSVPSARLAAVRVGQRLEFTVDALAGRLFTGQVMFINPSVDEVSRAGKVVAEVRNPDAALKGGLFVKGRILVSTRADVLQVPRAALVNWNVADGTAEVFVVHDGTAERRPVRTGPAAGESVAILAGLAGGDRVVTRGGFALKSGDRVTVSEGGK